jgi:hypothetical protein
MAYNRIFEQGGWQRIVKITPQSWTEPRPCGDGLYCDTVVDEIVWLETKDAVFAVDLAHGDTLQGLVDFYTWRGYTDDRACFFKSL